MGIPNHELDLAFTAEEICVVLSNIILSTAPGRDQINNKILRNLDGAALDSLLEYINTFGKKGEPHRSGDTLI
ncbi:hypothetical protein HPB50_004614 [Hyalomma asiaticum]|uniref:Uncharacterized protein n=1 Tax=Hyalomma asiaticum TaxID=266040 RepID=A0ACB7TB38_HYAAI|nr:hypothetical protein HPB50_004614 [Hyalomma asiaticum]